MRRATTTVVHVALAAAITAGAGCTTKSRTEIVVGLATDLNAPAPLASVHLEAIRLPQGIPVGMAEDRAISGTPAQPYTIPGTYGVYSDAGTADRVRVKLTAVDDSGQILVVRTAVFNLVPEKTLFLRLGLVSACVNRTDCDETMGQTCVDGRCEQEKIDSSTLPSYQQGDERVLGCQSAVQYLDTSTGQPLMQSATPCASGMCSEGVCLVAPPNGGAGGMGGGSGGMSGGGAGGAGGSAGAGGQAGAGGASQPGMPPQLTTLVPTSAAAGSTVTLEVHGQGISDGWTIVFNGGTVPTQIVQGSDGPVATATFTIVSSTPPGQVPVWLENGPMATNTVFFTIAASG